MDAWSNIHVKCPDLVVPSAGFLSDLPLGLHLVDLVLCELDSRKVRWIDNYITAAINPMNGHGMPHLVQGSAIRYMLPFSALLALTTAFRRACVRWTKAHKQIVDLYIRKWGSNTVHAAKGVAADLRGSIPTSWKPDTAGLLSVHYPRQWVCCIDLIYGRCRLELDWVEGWDGWWHTASANESHVECLQRCNCEITVFKVIPIRLSGYQRPDKSFKHAQMACIAFTMYHLLSPWLACIIAGLTIECSSGPPPSTIFPCMIMRIHTYEPYKKPLATATASRDWMSCAVCTFQLQQLWSHHYRRWEHNLS
jgi:hypothetical protein